MEAPDLHQTSSLRRSGSVWRNTGVEVFSRSTREEDDEEALKWANLEKLPTYNRLKKGLLTGSKGYAREIEIKDLGIQEKKNLMERLLKVAEEDNEKFLLKLKNRIDRVGVDLPTIEVRFQHIDIEADALMGSKALPSFINYSIGLVESFLNLLHLLPNKKKKLTILHSVSGIIKPRRMALLLGPPSSGKTTLMLALAGKLDPSLRSAGSVTYNGHEMSEFVPQRTAAYISQHDLHIGEMTVRETLAFSARCQGVGSRYEMLVELARREKAANIKPDPDIDVYMKAAASHGEEASLVTDYILKILGLEICADTMVGDEMLRGISGGQRKRVTTGEMLVGPARALFMDEISTGLDSSTTYQIVNALKQYVHTLSGTALISLLQPAPETFNLFDDIVLLSDGYIVYQGPRTLVLEFFESMGFKCPERKGVADFLQEVTSKKDQRQYWRRRDGDYRYVNSKEFADAFEAFSVGEALREELSVKFDRKRNHPAALTTSKYGVGVKELVKACMCREYLLMKRNSFVYIFKLLQLFFMALVTMTLFFRTEMEKKTLADGSVFSGALFFTVVMIMFNGMSEVPLSIQKLPVFYKQRDLFFFPAWAYALPTWVLKIPIAFVEVAMWVFISYYVIGYDPSVSRLFKQYFLLVIVNQMASGLFRFVAATGRNMIVANTIGSFAVLIFSALSGFVLVRNDVKKWWIWGYWCSPMMYAQNAIMSNEFLGRSWKKVDEALGPNVIKAYGYFAESYWYWLGIATLFGFTLLYNSLYALALSYLAPFEKQRAVISTVEEEEEEEQQQQEETEAANNVEKESKKRGMVLPFEPHSLTFEEIRYFVDMPMEMRTEGVQQERLELLKGITGAFRPGILTALMGVSGAGKTTLMDVLAGRKTGGYIEGTITISGHPKKQETFARISGYCEQNDIHSPHLTVYESLLYSAWLRLPRDVDPETRKMFLDEVMELVELTTLSQALVGLPGVNGLSTEQRKRLTIAVELVANPSIIFMDEPTSGLDARAAAIVMRTVRNTVNTGRTVVCTIHQPSIDIFEAFDELFLMKRGGETIYAGPLGHQSSHLIKYFQSIHGVPPITHGYNPATWMLEVTASSQEAATGADFASLYKNSQLRRTNGEMIKGLSRPTAGSTSREIYFPTKYSQPFLTQCIACFWKQRISYWRNPPYTAVRFLFTTIIALTFGTMFWDLGSRIGKQQDLVNSMGSMYTAVLFLGIQNAASVQPVVAVERTVFYREKAAGMFSEMPYALAQVAIEIPYVFAQGMVYGVVVYAMIGFEWSAAKFMWYLFFMYFTLLYFTFYGMMAVAVTPNQNVASIVSAAFYAIWNLFSGFIVPRPRMAVWWRWYYWCCPVSWTLYGLIGSQYGDIEDVIGGTDQTVKQFLKTTFGMRHDFVGVVAAVILGITLLFAFTFAVSIKTFNFQRR